ncbi:MAG: YncE family protein [Kofleriaceae bacterium]
MLDSRVSWSVPAIRATLLLAAIGLVGAAGGCDKGSSDGNHNTGGDGKSDSGGPSDGRPNDGKQVDAATTADGLPVIPPGAKRYLYVANDSGDIDIFDIADNHKKLRSFAVQGNPSRFRGLIADVKHGRLFWSSSDPDPMLGAIDLKTDQPIWGPDAPSGCDFPDRISVTVDGSALYVPCKDGGYRIIDAATGDEIKQFSFDGSPHNSFIGESGTYAYATGYQNDTMQVWDPVNHTKVRDIGPFSSGIRPFSVTRDEKYVAVNLTNAGTMGGNGLPTAVGFGLGDVATGEVIGEYLHDVPAMRVQMASNDTKDAYPDRDEWPHGGKPYSHGLAIRQGANEVWYLDDIWGYMYVWNIAQMPPTFVGEVPLFQEIDKAWTRPGGSGRSTYWRWLNFSIDGRYAYPGTEGIVVDAQTRTMLDVRVTPSEKFVEIVFDGTEPVLTTGQNGGWYAK